MLPAQPLKQHPVRCNGARRRREQSWTRLMRMLGQFDRMIPLWFVPWPTASTVPPLEAAIPARKLTPAGVATMLQPLPSQCSVNGPRSWCPTAHTSLAATAATAARPLFPWGFGLGLGTTLQLVPSQCSITAVG